MDSGTVEEVQRERQAAFKSAAPGVDVLRKLNYWVDRVHVRRRAYRRGMQRCGGGTLSLLSCSLKAERNSSSSSSSMADAESCLVVYAGMEKDEGGVHPTLM